MRRAGWLFPCLLACTSATPPPDAAGSTKEAEVSPEVATEIPPICDLGATRPCYPGPEATEGVGACKAGVETCEAAGFGACTGAVVPAADEDCRTPHDEDCDGRSDDCPEVTLAFSVAFTSERELSLASWGGGLGVLRGARLWVVEPGGRVIDVNPDEASRWPDEEEGDEEHEEGDAEDFAEELEADEEATMLVGGAWPGALLRTYETGGTRAGAITEQERWSGQTFATVEHSDEHLQWLYEDPLPWRNGHAIALKTWSMTFDTMEALDDSTLEFGGIEAAEQRKLQRKVDRLLERAQTRLVIVAAEEAEPLEPLFEVFSVRADEEPEGDDGEGAAAAAAEGEPKADRVEPESASKAGTGVKEEPATEATAGEAKAAAPEPVGAASPGAGAGKPAEPATKDAPAKSAEPAKAGAPSPEPTKPTAATGAGEPTKPAVATGAAEPTTPAAATPEPAKASPKVTQPPALPNDIVRTFTVLSDATVVVLTADGLTSWKPKQRQWIPMESPSSFSAAVGTRIDLYPGADGELLLLVCAKDAPSELWRRDASAWSNAPLPTPTCPTAFAVAPDRTQWAIIERQLWQRRPGDAEPWTRVLLPGSWKPTEVVAFDGRIWIAAWGDGLEHAVLVDHPVPRTRVLPPT